MKIFNFTISSDILSGKVDGDRLDEEIRKSAITIALDGVSVSGDSLTIEFKADLIAADETALYNDTTGPAGGLVGNHSGDPLEDPLTSNGIPRVKIEGPEENDGKLLVTNSPSPGKGWNTSYTSAGDDLVNKLRGKGDVLKVTLAAPGNDSQDIQFLEPVWLHDGELSWDPSSFDHSDTFEVSVIIPGNTATPNGSNTGNCNLVEIIPSSNLFIIIPAAGDGSHDVDLDISAPAQSQSDTGYFDVDTSTGVITPSASPGSAAFNLYTFQIEPFFCPQVMMGNPLGVFEVDAYQSKWISERTKIRLKVNKASAGGGTCGGHVMVYRKNVTTS